MSWQLVAFSIETWIMVYDKVTGVPVVIICYDCFCLSSDLEIAFSLYWPSAIGKAEYNFFLEKKKSN